MAPAWSSVLSRYATTVRLATRARGIPFDVVTSASVIVVTASTGRSRRITETEFDRFWPRASLLEPGTEWRRATRNSSYLESIAADLGGLTPQDQETSPATEQVAVAASDSVEQREAERLIIAALSQDLDVPLDPGTFGLATGVRVTVDGYALDPPVLVEAWAHQGRPKPAQKAKVMSDALKLLWLERTQFPSGTRKILALADADAAAHFLGTKTWMAQALSDLGVEVVVVDLPTAVRKGVRQAQKRQSR